MYIGNTCLEELYDGLNVKLRKIENLIMSNRVSLNVEKTVHILLSGKKSEIHDRSLNILLAYKVFRHVVKLVVNKLAISRNESRDAFQQIARFVSYKFNYMSKHLIRREAFYKFLGMYI